MKRLSLIRTCHVLRYHFHMDTDATKYDACLVEIFPQSPVLVRTDGTWEDLWREVIATITLMRRVPGRLPYPSSIFQPFAYITACDSAREATELSIKNHVIVGELHPDHAERVRSLCIAMDLVELQIGQAGVGPVN